MHEGRRGSLVCPHKIDDKIDKMDEIRTLRCWAESSLDRPAERKRRMART